ncbi:MAG: transposase [Chloroflexi bacterium]|nr:transposase [Chloroflexota bacterium]
MWGVGYDEPWALVTNDERLTGYEYARRNWQEQSFRDLKSGGWHWGDSRLRSPHHVANLLILLAIAYTWMVASAVKRSRQVAPNPWSVAPTVLSGACGVSFGKDCVTAQVVHRHTVCLGFTFIPDTRLT